MNKEIENDYRVEKIIKSTPFYWVCKPMIQSKDEIKDSSDKNVIKGNDLPNSQNS